MPKLKSETRTENARGAIEAEAANGAEAFESAIGMGVEPEFVKVRMAAIASAKSPRRGVGELAKRSGSK